MSELYYLDHAAATPLDTRVFAAMQPYFVDQFYNPSSPYAPAVVTRRAYEDAKHRMAVCIGGKGDEIVMTAGATESINLMFGSVDGHVVTTAIEHPAVLAAARSQDCTIVEVDAKGRVDPDSLAKVLRPDTQLVSVVLANNEIGTIQPLRDIATVIERERRRRADAGERTPLYFHSDASQGVGQIDVHVARLGVDALTVNAGKLYGPKQTALLWAASHVRLRPCIVGGGQERGLRSGTENVANVIGFATALELATSHRNFESKRLARLRDSIEATLVREFPTAVVSGARKKRLPGHLHISFPGLDAERLIFALELRGVLVATGSACAANKGTRSHVLTAIGLAPDVADGSLRITLGRLNDDETVADATAILVEVIKHEQERVGV
ncbi:MAG: cysteine desulfurase family protein [Candidatus Saccharimonas sp.]